MHSEMHNEMHNGPKQKLVPVFGASEHIDTTYTTLALAKSAAARGETVLMLDAQNGDLMERAGIIYSKTVEDLMTGESSLRDVQYVTSNEHFTAMACGNMQLGEVLGSLAALSLDYDWVFVSTQTGCTPDHVRLAGASDIAVLSYSAEGDEFMRAYWMMDSIRARHPKFDPVLSSIGDPVEARETANMLRKTIAAFLGAAPTYTGHGADKQVVSAILEAADTQTKRVRVA